VEFHEAMFVSRMARAFEEVMDPFDRRASSLPKIVTAPGP
jgi:hypothetical protein